MPQALRYVLKAQHKEGETPFSGCTSRNAWGKATKKDGRAYLSTLKESIALPTRKCQPKVSRLPLPGFASCSKTLLNEEENSPNAQTTGGFDLNAYKPLGKAGYNFNNPVALVKVSG